MAFDTNKLKKYPTKSGVYIMKDINTRVLYVGKAINLRNRLKQYFIHPKDTRVQIGILTKQVEEIETIVVSNNKEALILENTLIKKYSPKYNILLKDDKTYISICLTTKHKWPMLKLVRLKKTPKDKNLYFGPYTNAKAARSVKELLLKLFPLRQCSNSELSNRTRPCILYDIKKCIAPCVKKCTKQEYDLLVDKIKSFLKGKDTSILKSLKSKMKIASQNLEYEKAQEYLELINQINHLMQSQFVDILSNKNTDVIALYRSATAVVIAVLTFIDGRLTTSEHFSFSSILSYDADVMESFLLQNYINKKAYPKEILISQAIENTNLIEEMLEKKAHKKIKITHPEKGKKFQLTNLALDNAITIFDREKNKKALYEKQLLELQETLKLNNFPHIIECFDTSNISGTSFVAAMITYIDGFKDKKHTKLFKIKSKSLSDFDAMKEVLLRHYSKKEKQTLPNLLILDGGKPQLTAALEILKKLNIASLDIIALTKESAKHTKSLTKEKVYIPYQKDPIIIDPKSPLLFLLQKIRDDAHHTAISFHKKRRSKKFIKSSLDDIKGIGPVKKTKLLKHFKSIAKLKQAKRKDLENLKFLTSKDIDKLLKL